MGMILAVKKANSRGRQHQFLLVCQARDREKAQAYVHIRFRSVRLSFGTALLVDRCILRCRPEIQSQTRLQPRKLRRLLASRSAVKISLIESRRTSSSRVNSSKVKMKLSNANRAIRFSSPGEDREWIEWHRSLED
jgi:hypothetical protein